MTLLEFAEKTSPTPLTAWQRYFLTMYEEAVKDEWDRLSLSRTLRYGDTLVSIFTTKQHKQQEG